MVGKKTIAPSALFRKRKKRLMLGSDLDVGFQVPQKPILKFRLKRPLATDLTGWITGTSPAKQPKLKQPESGLDDLHFGFGRLAIGNHLEQVFGCRLANL